MLLSEVPEIHGAVRRRRERDEQRPRAADDEHRGAAGEQLAQRGEPAARRDPQPGRARSPARRRARRSIFVSKPRPTATPLSTSQRVRPSSKRAHGEPDRRDAQQRQQLVGVVVARHRDRDRRRREREAGDRAAEAAEAPAHEVVDEDDARHPHQRLRNEDRERVEAEHAHRQRLDPQRQRRLVDRLHAARVERGVEEVVPARRHRADGRRVVGVRPVVAAERPQVQQRAQRRSGRRAPGRAAPPRRRARARLAPAARRRSSVRSPRAGPCGLGLEDVPEKRHCATGSRRRFSRPLGS